MGLGVSSGSGFGSSGSEGMGGEPGPPGRLGWLARGASEGKIGVSMLCAMHGECQR
jgi:hypothetical protein